MNNSPLKERGDIFSVQQVSQASLDRAAGKLFEIKSLIMALVTETCYERSKQGDPASQAVKR